MTCSWEQRDRTRVDAEPHGDDGEGDGGAGGDEVDEAQRVEVRELADDEVEGAEDDDELAEGDVGRALDQRADGLHSARRAETCQSVVYAPSTF